MNALNNTAMAKTIYRRDYQSPDYQIKSVDLTFELGKSRTLVTAKMAIVRQADLPVPLCLHGDNLILKYIALDGETLVDEDYTATSDSLILSQVPAQFELTLTTQINPAENTTLMGLYHADDLFCTQCEAQGFRSIMYFLDRPDVMATYTTTIIADKTDYPVLLSNGNLVDSGQGKDNTPLGEVGRSI